MQLNRNPLPSADVLEKLLRRSTINKIASEFGVSKSAVWGKIRREKMRREGIEPRNRYKPQPKAEIDKSSRIVWTTATGAQVTLPRVKFIEA